MKKLTLFILFSMTIFVTQSLRAQPWGKDAELALRPLERYKKVPLAKQEGPGVMVSEALIRFHQEVISPADGPRSHFKPSSSQYTLDAVRKYGFFKGWMLGCDRLMRENDEKWVYRTIPVNYKLFTKHDPVR